MLPCRQLERVQLSTLAAALPGHVLADVLPEVAVDGHLVARNVLGHGHPWQFDDTALDRVHEREVTYRPGKQSALGVAGAAEEERSGREVHDPARAEIAVHGFQAGDPEPGRLVVLLSFFLFVSREFLVVLVARLRTVAVVRLVVENENVLHAHEVGHHPLEHLAFGFQGVQLFSSPLKQGTPTRREFDPLAELEGVVVRDHDLRAMDVVQQIAGY